MKILSFFILLVIVCATTAYRHINEERESSLEKALEDVLADRLLAEQHIREDNEDVEQYAEELEKYEDVDVDDEPQIREGEDEDADADDFDFEDETSPVLKNHVHEDDLDNYQVKKHDPWRSRIRIRTPRIRLRRLRLRRILVPRIRIPRVRVRLPRVRLRLRRIRLRLRRIIPIRLPKLPGNPCKYTESQIVNTINGYTCDQHWKTYFQTEFKFLVDSEAFVSACKTHTVCSSCANVKSWTKAQCDNRLNSNLIGICREMATDNGVTDQDTVNWCNGKVASILQYTRAKAAPATAYYCQCGIEEVGSPNAK